MQIHPMPWNMSFWLPGSVIINKQMLRFSSLRRGQGDYIFTQQLGCVVLTVGINLKRAEPVNPKLQL